MSELIVSESLSIDKNPAALYLSSLAAGGRPTMVQSLNLLANMLGAPDASSCNWAALRYKHTVAIRTKLIDNGYKWSTVNKILCALRGTLKAAYLDGQMTAEEYQKAVSVAGVKGNSLPPGRALSHGEIQALITVCENENSSAGGRDAAIISVMYATGLRRAEVVNLNLNDYDPENGKLVVVSGKGNEDRTSYILNGASRALNYWLAARGLEEGPLFIPINKSGVITNSKMCSQSVYNMLRKRANQAGIPRFSPHDLRRTHITDMLYAGADVLTVAKLVGHKSVETTKRYDMRGEDTKREAAAMLHIPFGRK